MHQYENSIFMTCGIASIKVATLVPYIKLEVQNLFLEVLNFGSAWSIERFFNINFVSHFPDLIIFFSCVANSFC